MGQVLAALLLEGTLFASTERQSRGLLMGVCAVCRCRVGLRRPSSCPEIALALLVTEAHSLGQPAHCVRPGGAWVPGGPVGGFVLVSQMTFTATGLDSGGRFVVRDRRSHQRRL